VLPKFGAIRLNRQWGCHGNLLVGREVLWKNGEADSNAFPTVFGRGLPSPVCPSALFRLRLPCWYAFPLCAAAFNRGAVWDSHVRISTILTVRELRVIGAFGGAHGTGTI